MNSKKRWIITVIAVLALAAVIVTGIVLNHSADRVLKATDGTETTAEGAAPAEETAEAQPAEEMLEMVLPAGENGTEVSSSLMAVPENTEPAGEEPEEALALPEMPEGNAASADMAAENTLQNNADTGTNGETAPQETDPAGTSAQEQKERVLITTDGETIVEDLQQSAAGSTSADSQETEDLEQKKDGEEETEEEIEEEGETELRAVAADGAQVIVRKLDGTFPAGAYVKVFLLSGDSAQSAVENALEDDAKLVDLIAYDITIYDKDGKEIVPDETVEVSIVGASLENGETASVYQIEDSGAAKKVTDVEDSAQASFKPAGVVK